MSVHDVAVQQYIQNSDVHTSTHGVISAHDCLLLTVPLTGIAKEPADTYLRSCREMFHSLVVCLEENEDIQHFRGGNSVIYSARLDHGKLYAV